MLPCHCNMIKAIILTVRAQWLINYEVTSNQFTAPQIRSIKKLENFASQTTNLPDYVIIHCDKKASIEIMWEQ